MFLKNLSSDRELDRELAEFYLDRQSRNLTDATLRWYRVGLTEWHEHLSGYDLHATHEVTPTILRQFIVNLGKRRNDGGVVHVFGCVRAFLKWYEDEYAPTNWTNPLTKVKAPKRGEEILPPLDTNEFNLMLGGCNVGTLAGDRDRAILLLLLDTGVRKSEASDLRIGDVKVSKGEVYVRRGKGRKSRTVFMGANTRRSIRSYLRHRKNLTPESPLWIGRGGNKISSDGLRQVLKRRAHAVGLDEPGFHDFRRAFAVNSLRNGMDIITLQRLLGHSDLRAINRYLALVTDDLRRSHQQYGVVDNLE